MTTIDPEITAVTGPTAAITARQAPTLPLLHAGAVFAVITPSASFLVLIPQSES